MGHVWLVTEWEWGGGGDDGVRLIGSFSSPELAEEACQQGAEGGRGTSVTKVSVDHVIKLSLPH